MQFSHTKNSTQMIGRLVTADVVSNVRPDLAKLGKQQRFKVKSRYQNENKNHPTQYLHWWPLRNSW